SKARMRRRAGFSCSRIWCSAPRSRPRPLWRNGRTAPPSSKSPAAIWWRKSARCWWPEMPISAAARDEARRLYAAFQAAGAVPVGTDVLQLVDVLLDLHGANIRARVYDTWAPLRGEMMMRPGLTVAVVQMHMAHGADAARYCYMGEVFRRQDPSGPRANDYLQ